MHPAQQPSRRRARGAIGEERAASLLQRLGFVVLERNVRVGRRELDIIALDDDTLVIVEVKARWSTAFGPPESSVTMAKQVRLREAAEIYLRQRKWSGRPWRIDVLALQMERDDVKSWELFRDCVEGA